MTADRPLQPCAACGEPCRGHWCSDSCRIAEDGPGPDDDYDPTPYENPYPDYPGPVAA